MFFRPEPAKPALQATNRLRHLQRGDSLEIGNLSPYASGSRYDGDFGGYFSIKCDEVQAAWPQANKFICKVRK